MMLEIRMTGKEENDTMLSDPSKDSKYGEEVHSEHQPNFMVPMSLIVIFLVVEIWPIFFVNDGNFVDIFLKYSVLIQQKDLVAPLLMQEADLNVLDSTTTMIKRDNDYS